MPDGRHRENGAPEGVLAHAAMLYYREGLTQGEIARRMGVSRATIVNYLRMARDLGIVEIRIRGESFAASTLSRRLVERYGLTDAYVALDDKAPGDDPDPVQRAATLGALALRDLLEPGDRLGIDWGDTMQRVAHAFPAGTTVPGLTVSQVVGSMHSRQLVAAEACAIEIARKTGAECRTLHVPAIVSTPELASQLRAEPIIARQLSEFAQLTKAIFSVGDLSAGTTLVTAGIATPEDMAHYAARGAEAIFMCHFVDGAGRPVPGRLSGRMLGMTLDDLAAVPVRMLVAGGERKRRATKALLAGGYVSHLVTDEDSAEWLVEN